MLNADELEKALRRAFDLGQRYWQQADSLSYTQNRRSDETRAKFDALVTETVAAHGVTAVAPAAPIYYVASRASVPERPAMWRRLRADGWPINSTWVDEAGEGETGDFTELWDRIEREIRAASALILFAECDDFPLKGALVECGIAIGAGKAVAVVLDFIPDGRTCKPIGSWIKHPLVSMHETVEEARAYLEQRTPGVARTEQQSKEAEG